MTKEQREKAWAAAQAIYDVLATYGDVEMLAAAISEVACPPHSVGNGAAILKEISMYLYTLHDGDMK